MNVAAPLAANNSMSCVMEQRLILGTDERDAEKQIDLWLSQNPEIEVVRIHEIEREPPSLLTFIGGKHVPRVSITVEYQQTDCGTRVDPRPSWTMALAQEDHREKRADARANQGARENLLTAEARRNMEDMA
jgi:hypothetical protein